jgi:hypothetical protein
MRLTLLFLITIALFTSCKRKVFNPSNYDDLVYRRYIPPPPPKEYIFRAKVDEKSWNTSGSGLVSGDTLTIKATVDGKILTLRLLGYSSKSRFLIGATENLATYAAVGASSNEFSAIGKSHGTVSLISFDKAYNQMEANFDFVLYGRGGDSLVVSGGYYKINFSPNDFRWQEDGLDYVGQQIDGSDQSNSYVVTATDTLSKRVLRIELPKSLPRGNSKYALGEVGGLPAVYYTNPVTGLMDVKAHTVSGYVTIKSNTDRVIKGSFADIRVGILPGGDPNNPLNDYLHGLDGSFSAKY